VSPKVVKDALLAVLDPDVMLRADRTAVQAAAANAERGAPLLSSEVRGAAAVARTFFGRAQAAQLGMVNGIVELVGAPAGQPRAVLSFTIAGRKILAIEVIADPERLSGLQVSVLTD
jgi:hypothetical protein